MYIHNRTYPIYKEGDEVFTTKTGWGLITPNKPYIVQKCYTPTGYVDDCNFIRIDIITDNGSIGHYASDKFQLTHRQIRDNIINELVS